MRLIMALRQKLNGGQGRAPSTPAQTPSREVPFQRLPSGSNARSCQPHIQAILGSRRVKEIEPSRHLATLDQSTGSLYNALPRQVLRNPGSSFLLPCVVRRRRDLAIVG